MKFLIFVSVLGLLGISAGLVYVGHKNQVEIRDKLKCVTECSPCSEGSGRGKEGCRCASRSKVENFDTRTEIHKNVQGGFKRTGCNKELNDAQIKRYLMFPDRGAKEMFHLCLNAKNGVSGAVSTCGKPSECRYASILPSGESTYDKFKYEMKKGEAIYGPKYGKFKLLDVAKDYCDRTIECKAIKVNSKREYVLMGGDLVKGGKKDFIWVKK